MSDPSSARRSTRLAKKDVQQRLRTGLERESAHSSAEQRRHNKATARKPYERVSSLSPSTASMAAGPSGSGSTTVRDGQNHPRRSLRISPTELVRREHALADAERDLELQREELALKIQAHREQERESVLALAERDAKTTLAHLEDHFQCPLCYEVVAAPYTVSSPDCGHTFCAVCILRWFFSRLHPPCGSWHDCVDCPICRARLIYTPDTPPRDADTFPFVPNRLATAVITAFIEKIGSHPVNTAMPVKKEEEEEGVLVSESKKPGGRKCSRKAKEEDEIPRTSAIDAWKESGALRTEWIRKEREGRLEMARLQSSWRMMGSADFMETKRRLGV